MNCVYIATSIDGFIAKKDGGIDWLHELPNPTGSDYGYSDFMREIDSLVMGRNTFEKVLSFGTWPYDKLVYVASTTLNEVPEELAGKVKFISGSPQEMVALINAEGYSRLYIDGGQLIQSFLAADIIDELIISRIPILLGSGISLFGELVEPLNYEHKETKVYDNTLVKSHYLRSRKKA